ncbi:ribose transport system permease protein [Lachnotalea glycerini]|uniref:Ribose transport system permease protein n=1 Tax=Lachnotalea glycerini TaxID=1763509 RepID=A0A318ENH8_9FIRM|nr:ABC transporter permease [Lachnotalea glycerini]PXV86277.1 ribose transport system permease protein [Lachnotalea glycerini]
MDFAKIRKSNSFSVSIIIVFMVVVMCFFKRNYLSADNISALLKVLAVTTLVGVSQMISIASGGMNVSIGSVGAMAAILSGLLMQNLKVPVLLSILIGIGIGVLCGIINGLLIYRNGGVGVASFLTTLATNSVFIGIIYMITTGHGVSKIPDAFVAIGSSKIGPVPTSVLIVGVLITLVYFMFTYTSLGRQILAFGANPKAAELYGISRFKTILSVNIIASILAAIAGMLVVMRVGTAQPDIGSDWMLQSFAAPLIGGTRQAGGKVVVFGVILGALVLTIIENALVHLGVDVYWTELINGVVIIVIMAFDRLRSIKN